MLTTRMPAIRSQALIGLSLLLVGMWIAWQLGGKIADGDMTSVYFAALGFAALFVAFTILRNWRLGFYFFFVWLLFEDFVRKFLGNNMAIYFAKDVLVGLVYISLFIEIRRGRAKLFHPPFWLPLSLFIWLGVLQIFNVNSPHILYGLMGFKIYFYYIPLMYVGYALIREDEDLRKFLVVNAIIAIAISGLGIAQAVVGNSFLNPAVLAPELAELGNLDKVTPLTDRVFNLPTSVFVSSGRFSSYLIVAAIVAMGSAGYLLLYSKRSRKLVYLSFGIVSVGTLLSGSRSGLLDVMASALVLSVGFLWGAPWRWQQAHRMVRAIRRTFIFAALGLAALLIVFPDAAGSRMAYYVETLNPSSSSYQASDRAWDYPIMNLELAFTNPHWVFGNGIGTGSLGTQYVARILKKPPLAIWVEEGYGDLIVEMGIVAPFLWLLWTASLLYFAWKAVYRLRETRFFPIGFAIVWYAFLLLFPLMYGALSSYQNYVNNAYLWLLVGILFRLPEILDAPAVNPPVASPRSTSRRRGGFRF